MKTQTCLVKRLSLIICFSALAFVLQTKAEGTNSGGGGNNIETAFKSYAIKMAEELVIDNSNREILQFSPEMLLVKARMMQPSCASKTDIQLLQSQQKLAYVKDPDSNIILLDCTGYAASVHERWSLFLARRNTSSRFLVVHELLRLLKFKNEDAYEKSGSIVILDLRQNQTRQSAVRDMITGKAGNKCEIAFKDVEQVALGIHKVRVEISPKFINDNARAQRITVILSKDKNEAIYAVMKDLLELEPPSYLNEVIDALDNIGCLK